MRAALAVVVVLALGLAFTGRAEACSLTVSAYPIEPRALVAGADAAFIGTLLDIRLKNPPSPNPSGPVVISSADPLVFTYRVEEQIKGQLPERVEVVAPSGASCGLDGPVGRRTGLLLRKTSDGWTAGLADQIPPDTLRRGALPLPAPDGVGPPAFLGAGNLGPVRTVLLDASGRTIRYGAGSGGVAAASLCPGKQALVELVSRKDGIYVASRRLPTLEVTRERRVLPSGYGDSVVCRDRAGSISLATVIQYQSPRPETRLLRVTPIGARTLERAVELSVGVRGDSAYVSADGRLTAWNLRTGARRFIAGLAFRELAVSQDGRRVAGFAPEELVLVDVRTRAVRRRPWHPGPSNATWIGSDRVVVAGNGTLDTFDLSLRPVLPQQFWPAHTTAFTSVGPVGVNRQGELITIRNGDIHRLGRLFSPAVSVLVPL